MDVKADRSEELIEKEKRLQEILSRMGSVVVALSGGVDSAYLAYAAHRVLGDRMLAVTGESPSYPDADREAMWDFIKRFGVPHRVINTDELNDPRYASNPSNRCFFCKEELFQKLGEVAVTEQIKNVVDGTNLDDLGDHRPGLEAARQEGVRSPLKEAGLRKDDIRELSRKAGLPTWDRPESACLASRFPQGEPITAEKLSRVQAGENFLREKGFRQFRVRHHGDLVRLEIAPEELGKALDPAMAKLMAGCFRELGYRFVTLDLEGYRRGSLSGEADGSSSGSEH